MRFFSVNEYAMSAPERNQRSGKEKKARDMPYALRAHGISENYQPVQEKSGEERPVSLLVNLLDFRSRTGFDELLQDTIRVRLGYSFLDRLGGTVNQVLGFL